MPHADSAALQGKLGAERSGALEGRYGTHVSFADPRELMPAKSLRDIEA